MKVPSEPTSPNRLLATSAAERPQEKLQRLGPQALGDAELLAMLLRSGTRGNDVLTLSTRLLSEAGSLAALLAWKEPDFVRLRGIGRVKALQLVTVMELARRALGQQEGEAPMLREADQIFRHLRPVSTGLEVEKFWVLCLNRSLRCEGSPDHALGPGQLERLYGPGFVPYQHHHQHHRRAVQP